jgi:arginine-tRNA-protein transferase
MKEPYSSNLQKLCLYLTPDHPCAYLPEQAARTLFVDPTEQPDARTYAELLEVGFRRSGNHVYRPHCNDCRACVSVRIPVAHFQAKRSQKRCWKRLVEDVEIAVAPPDFNPEHFALYQRYTATRHGEGDMKDVNEAQYLEFLTSDWCATHFVEFRLHGRLMAIAVTDQLTNALSAVYTFFDPDLSAHSPGVFAILWQLRYARTLGLSHLYLGYWIAKSDKMNYKSQYRPLEAWNGRSWTSYPRGMELGCG